jgi:hypothetical protein
MVMSEKAMVEATMVAARIHLSCAREMGGGVGVLFMLARTINCSGATAKLGHPKVHFRNGRTRDPTTLGHALGAGMTTLPTQTPRTVPERRKVDQTFDDGALFSFVRAKPFFDSVWVPSGSAEQDLRPTPFFDSVKAPVRC